MVKTSVMCARIDYVRKPHLGNSPQSLEIFMLDQIEHQFTWNCNKTVDGIVDDLKLGKGFQTLTFN